MKWNLPLFLVLLAVCLVVYPLWGTTKAVYIFGNIAQLVALICATIILYSTSDSFPENDFRGKAYLFFALGMLVWTLSQLLNWYCEVILNRIPYGTVSDILWLIGYALFFVGFYYFLSHARKIHPEIIASDWALGVVLLIVYSVIFVKLIFPQLTAEQEGPVVKFLDFIYPTMDFILAGVCAFLLKKMPGTKGPALLFISFCALTYADLVYGSARDLSSFLYLSTDVIYLSAYFLMAQAAISDHNLFSRGTGVPARVFGEH